MRALTTTEEKGRSYILRTIRGLLAVGVLLAVPALAFSQFSGDLFAFWTGDNVGTGSPLTFDAPASAVAKLNTPVSGTVSPSRLTSTNPQALMLDNWRDTSLLTDLIGQFLQFNATQFQQETFFDFLLILGGTPPQTLGIVLFQQLAFNNAISSLQLQVLNQVASASPI